MKLDQLDIKWHRQILCLLVCVLILLLYGQTSGYDFVSLDDPHYVSYNKYVQQGLTSEGIQWAFSFVDKGGSYWQPLTWISHMVDVALFNNNAGFHHLVNVLWHFLNTCLLFFFLHKATGSFWSSSLVALLFALHPMNVESVAWISERKNLLSTFFWFAILFTYISYARNPRVTRYLALMTLFCLGLMVKPMLVTLPCVLLLMDYWPLKRISFSKADIREKKYDNVRRFLLLCLEKFPFFFLALLTAYLVTESMSEYRNVVSLSEIPMHLRIENMLVSYVTYITKLFWPSDLGAFHPYPTSLSVQSVLGSIAVLGCCSFLILFPLREKKYLTVGWLWFLGTLVPVSGIMQAGVWPSWAERWAYIPYVGLFIMLSWSIRDILHRFSCKSLIVLFTLVLVCIHGFLGWQQVQQWQNSVSLYQNALSTDSDDTFAEIGLGNALAAKGLTEKAAVHYYRAFSLNFNTVINRQLNSTALTQEHFNKHAIDIFRTALQKGTAPEKLYYYMGLSFITLKQYNEALSCFTKELQINQDQPKVINALAITYNMLGDPENAVLHFKKNIQYNSRDVSYEDFADALIHTGKLKEAEYYYRLAINENPDRDELLIKLGELLMRTKQYPEAYSSFINAFSKKPDTIKIHSQLVNLFIKQQQVEEALSRKLNKARLGDLSMSRLEDIAINLVNYSSMEKEVFALLKYFIIPKGDGTHPSVLQAKTRGELIEKMIDKHLKVLGTDPTHYETIINMAQLYEQLGDRERSIFYFREALNIDSGQAELHYNLANLLTAEGYNYDAKEHYERALEIQPFFLNALNNLGILLAKENKIEQAIAHFQKAISIDPSFVDGHTSMGVINYQRGNTKEAILHFQKAANLAPENQHIRLMLEKVQSLQDK